MLSPFLVKSSVKGYRYLSNEWTVTVQILMKTDINIIDTLAGTTELINLDQLNTRNPITVLTGAEIVPAQKSGITGGLLLSTLKSWVKSAFVANDISNATTIGKSVLTSANLADVKSLLEIPNSSSIGRSVLTAANLADVKSLLEIPTLPTPLTPFSIGTSLTLTATHVNRKVILTASGITLTTNSAVKTLTDTLFIINPTAGSVTLNAGAGEDFIVVGSSTPVTTYTIVTASALRATLLDTNTWFIEPSIV